MCEQDVSWMRVAWGCPVTDDTFSFLKLLDAKSQGVKLNNHQPGMLLIIVAET